MKKLTFIICLFFLFPFAVKAQTTFPMGLAMDDEEYERLPRASENIQLNDGRRSLLRQVDLSPYCPEIRCQGEVASCVGWSVGYGAMTIEKAIKNNWTDKRVISENAYSALFIYNQISRGDCDRGISLAKALKLLQEKGNCLARDFDFNTGDCSKAVPATLIKNAESDRISNYIRLFAVDAEPGEKIDKIKRVLAQNKPVPVGMKVLQNFYNIRQGEETWWPNIGDTTYAGGHAMVVVGFDDDKFYQPGFKIPPAKQGAFKLMNSWGKNWGQDGFIWIRYSDFADYCRYAFAILLEEGDPIKLEEDGNETALGQIGDPSSASRALQQFSGAFGFRYYIGWDDGHVFKEAAVQLEGDHYRLEGDWSVGNRFQLYTRNGFDNGYIYVLSIDEAGKAEVHFPRSQDYNPAFEGLKESALVMDGGDVLTIPGKDRVLTLTQTGRDQLVVLFSTKNIVPEYIAALCAELSAHRENLLARLRELLGRHMVSLSDIAYSRDKMGFEAGARSKGAIVPIVLKVDVSP